MFFNRRTTATGVSAMVVLLATTTASVSAASDKDLALLAQIIGAPTNPAARATASSQSSFALSTAQRAENRFRKPPSQRDPADLEKLRGKQKERIIVNTRRRVRNGEILSGEYGENQVRPDAIVEIEGGQLFLEEADLNNAGAIIIKGPRDGTPNPRTGELILRSAALTGSGSIEVQDGGRLSIEGTGNHAVRGLDIVIRQGGELLMEGDEIEFDEFFSPADNTVTRGSISNQGTIRLRGNTRIQRGAHDIQNQAGSKIIMEAGEFEANRINNWPGAQFTIESSGETVPASPVRDTVVEYPKHLRRAYIRNYGAGNDRGILRWKSKTIEVGAFGNPIASTRLNREVSDADIQAFASDVVISNQGDLVLEQQLTREEMEQGPPPNNMTGARNTTGARIENLDGAIIKGGGLLHGTLLNNGGTLLEEEFPVPIPQAEPSFTMRQITGDLSLSSGVYSVSINSANYGQYWISGTISIGPSTCKVTTTCVTGFPLTNYQYPILKSSTNILDSNPGTRIGFERIEHFRATTSTAPCSITWDDPPDTTFQCPNVVPVPTAWLTTPPKCYVIKITGISLLETLPDITP